MTNPTPEKSKTPRELFNSIEQEVGFARVLNAPVVVAWWLLGANVLFFFMAYGFGGMFLDERFSTTYYSLNQIPVYTGMKVNVHVLAGDWWRLVSSMFVHLDIMHIGFNGYGIVVLGPLVEKFYGARRFFVIYMIAGLIGAAASFYFSDIPSGGASGAIYGLIGSLAVFGFKFRKDLPKRVSKAFTTNMAPWIIGGIGIGFLDAIPFDNAAHIGGLLGGAFVTLLMRSRLERTRVGFGRYAINALTIFSLLLLVYTLAEWSAEATQCLVDRDAFVQCYPEMVDRI